MRQIPPSLNDKSPDGLKKRVEPRCMPLGEVAVVEEALSACGGVTASENVWKPNVGIAVDTEGGGASGCASEYLICIPPSDVPQAARHDWSRPYANTAR